MESHKQKDIFLQSEGNNWFLRNKELLGARNMSEDLLLGEILKLNFPAGKEKQVLEVGCGHGKRLIELTKKGFTAVGIDPSPLAIEEAKKNGIEAHIGTADDLQFPDNKFDVLIFGFCLYLCDRDDLFKIAAEANRVLKKNGYLCIVDFYSKTETENNYHHREGVKSFKMDYSHLFTWHPNYLLMQQTVRTHDGQDPTSDKNEWVAISILKKI